MITTAALGLLAVTASGSMVSADMISGTTNKTDVTLTEGSGTDVTPVVPDDTHDDDPSTGDVGSLSIPFASNITFGQQEIQQGDTGVRMFFWTFFSNYIPVSSDIEEDLVLLKIT